MIRFTTINVDDVPVTREFTTIEKIKDDWNSEDGTTLPMLDDELVSASINEMPLNFPKNATFYDFAALVGLVEYKGD